MDETQERDYGAMSTQKSGQLSALSINDNNLTLQDQRHIRVDKLGAIIDTAVSLEAIDKSRSEHKSELVERLASRESSLIPLSAVYDIAQEVYGLNRENIDRAISMYEPSREAVISDLGSHRARPDTAILLKIIKKVYPSELLKALRKAYPCEEFIIDKKFNSEDYYRIEKYRAKTFLSGIRKNKYKIKKRKVLLANHFIYCSHLSDLTVHDPLFLRGCGESIKSLESEYGCGFRITYTYVNLVHKSDPEIK
jgi:hypothetical protein